MNRSTCILLLLLSACNGRESSPEGRMQSRYEVLEQQIDSLSIQNEAIMDSLTRISYQLNELKNK